MNHRSFGIVLSIAFSGLVGGLVSCGGSDDTAFSSMDPAPGTERGLCRSGGKCDAGLECRSGLCVEADAGTGGTSTGTGGSAMSAAGESSTTGGSNVAGTASTEGGATSAEGGGPGGVGDAGAGNPGAGGGGEPVECNGSHPQVSDKNRFCAAGACYCNDPFDTCFPQETAKTCCESTPRCGAEPADRGVNCTGAHPVIGPPRTCTSGNCFCSDGDVGDWDVCLPQDIAAFCCPPGVSLTCVN
jgi:hypothetical protein